MHPLIIYDIQRAEQRQHLQEAQRRRQVRREAQQRAEQRRRASARPAAADPRSYTTAS